MSIHESTRATPADERPRFPGLSGVEPLGSGAMGSVFRARQDDLGRAVAVKLLRSELCADRELVERFTREARILATLEHPGIVPVHYSGAGPNGPFYVMGLVEGVSVERALAGRPALEVARVFRDAAASLAAAHERGVLHRDVKPDNLLVDARGRPVWVDFGLSTSALHPAGRSDEERVCGTPDYLAPELLEGRSASASSDLYALGATLYRTLTGRVPFPADTLAEKLRAIRQEDPPLLRTLRPDVPKELQAICLKALERSPADRYASAAEFARDLDRYVQGDAVEALPLRSQKLLRLRLQRHLADVAEWSEQGLLDDSGRATLERAYEHVEEQRRGLLREVLGSLPNLLLLVGILLSVFGPVVLLLVTWEQQSAVLRLGLPLAPLLTLTAFGLARRRARDPRRALACLLGACLLAAPLAFALADLVPALHAVTDASGVEHAVMPGPMWLAGPEAPDWQRDGSHPLEWKLGLTSLVTLAAAFALYRRLRAAAFLWIACLAGLGTVVCAALLLDWRDLPLAARWGLALAGSAALPALGVRFERSFQRDRAWPFYGFGLLASFVTAANYSEAGMPAGLWLSGDAHRAGEFSVLFHGLLFTLAGLLLHFRGPASLRQMAGAPLLLGFALTMGGASGVCASDSTAQELLLVATSLAFLVLGLGLQRNLLVLPAAIALPITIGAVSQRHVDALWAWSAAIVLGGALLVALSFRVRRRTPTSAAPACRPAR